MSCKGSISSTNPSSLLQQPILFFNLFVCGTALSYFNYSYLQYKSIKQIQICLPDLNQKKLIVAFF